MTALHRRLKTLEARQSERPMSKADEEIVRARLWVRIQLIGAGRELPACGKRRDDQWPNLELDQTRAGLLARLESMSAANEDDREPGAKFIPLPDDELDRLEQFLIEGTHHERA